MRSTRLCPARPARFRCRAEDLRRLAGVARQHRRREFRFQPLPKKEAARALAPGPRLRPADAHAGKHGGAIGRTALPVLHALMFDFLNYASGRLDPSYDAIARKADVCGRTVADALSGSKALGIAALATALRRELAATAASCWSRRPTPTPCCRRRSGAATEPPPAAAARAGHMGRPPAPARSDHAGRSTAARTGRRRDGARLAGQDPGDELACARRLAGIFGQQLIGIYRECRLCQEPLTLLRIILCGAP